MFEEKDPTLDHKTIFSPRNISFALMFAAVMLFLAFPPNEGKRAQKNLKQTVGTKLFQIRTRLFIHQVAMVRKAPATAQAEALKQLQRQLHLEDQRGRLFRGKRIVQKFMILEYMGARVKPQVDKPVAATRIYKEYTRLYVLKRPLPKDALLFRGPAGAAARIRQFDLKGDTAGRAALEGKLQRSILALSMALMAGMLAVFALSIIAVGILIWKRPERHFPMALDTIPGESRRLMAESVILYLFLMLPGTVILQQAVKIPGLWPRVGLLAVIFGVVVYYFVSSAGMGRLRALLHFEITPLPPILPVRLAREVGIGVLAYAVLLPAAAMVNLLWISIVGTEAATRGAHPIIMLVEKNFLAVFFMAVVAAPIFEEVVFRGFLYGFFRGRLTPGLAAFGSGLIFAAVHPQGWIGLPALTLLGTGLAILREVRPSMTASIVCHALVNLSSLTMLSVLMKM